MERLLSRWHGNLVGPGVDNGFAIAVVEVRDDPLLEFSFRSHPDATQDGARHFREEALDQVEPGAMLWREHEAEAALALCGKPLVGLLRHVRRMILQNDLDRGTRRLGCVHLLEKADEFARAVAIFDSGMNLAGEPIDPRQQAQRSKALVFMVACDAAMLARERRQVRRRVGDRLDARLLVIRDERDVGSGLLRRRRRSFGSNVGGLCSPRTKYDNFLIDTQASTSGPRRSR